LKLEDSEKVQIYPPKETQNRKHKISKSTKFSLKRNNSGESKSQGEALSDNEISDDSLSADFKTSKVDFERAWKKYIELLIENGNLLISTPKFMKSKFCDLLHRQIETCSKMFLIVSMADKKKVAEYFRLMNLNSGQRTDAISLAKTVSILNSPDKTKQRTKNGNLIDKNLPPSIDVNAARNKALSQSNDEEFGDLVSGHSVNSNVYFPPRDNQWNLVDNSQVFPEDSKLINESNELRASKNKIDLFSFRPDDRSPEIYPRKNTTWQHDSVSDMMNIEDQSKSELLDSHQEQQNLYELRDSAYSFPNNGLDFVSLSKESKQRRVN